MTDNKYIKEIKKIIKDFDKESKGRYFVFGSSLRKEKFNDIDIGVIGLSKSSLKTADLKEKIDNTTIPYFVDVVDFDCVRKSFGNYVLNNEPIAWIN